jgi:four helix bundle protein
MDWRGDALRVNATTWGERSRQLEERLVDFGVRIIDVSQKLPRNAAGSHLANQIIRSGTSCAPNYGEARGAESYADFAHKIGIVLKELNESSIWLRMISKSALLPEMVVTPLIHENAELCKIFTSSTMTAKAKIKQMKLSKRGA